MKHQNFQLMTDSELVTEFKAGNQVAFNALYFKYKDELLIYLIVYVKDLYIAEDLAQVVFVKIFESIHSYSEKGKFKNWLFRIAYNEIISWFRKNSKMRYVSFSSDLKLPETGDSIEERLEQEEVFQGLMSGVASLNPSQKMVIILYLEGSSYKEIAALLNISLNSVGSLKYTAIRKLQKKLVVA